MFLSYNQEEQYYKSALCHSVTCIFLSLCSLYFQNWIVPITIIHSFIYFIIDIHLDNNWKILEPEQCFHHIISIIACIIALLSSHECQVFGIKLLVNAEIANPCWTIFRLRIKDSNEIHLPSWCSKFVSGLSFMIMFFITRFIVLYNLYMYHYPSNVSTSLFLITHIPLTCLNIYWMTLLLRGLVKEIKTMIE